MSEENLFYNDVAGVDETPIDISNLAKAEVLPKESVMLRMQIKGSEFQRQVASGEVIDKEGVDLTLVTTTKRMIDKKYLDPISKLDSAMRGDLYRIGLRPKFLGPGTIIVPIRLFNYTMAKIETFKQERERLVGRLIAQWEEAKLEIQLRNPDLYKEEEYPSIDEVRSMFSVDTQFFSVSFPEILERVNEDVYREHKAEAERQLEEALDEIKQGLRAGFYDLVLNLEDKVKGIGTERKVFKTGFVKDMRMFLETFDAKNLANDTELSNLVNQARRVLSGVSPEAIRNNLDVRITIEQELGSIRETLDAMVENRGRKATFA